MSGLDGRGPVLWPPPRSASIGSDLVPAAEPVVAPDPSLPPEGYRLRSGPGGVTIDAADEAGLRWARATLAQLAASAPAGMVPLAAVEDWPDVAVRGLMLDISRDKVPTMASLRAVIDLLSSWKMNHLQLYTEHAFAYAGHDGVWHRASPVTPAEMEELVAHGAAAGVEVVPNQNCLGHMERWLAVDRYRHLAVSPGGWRDGFGRLRHPTTLEPTDPGSLGLVRELLGQMLDAAPGDLVHVGLDEPWELSAAGRAADYADYVTRLRRAPELDGRTMLVWGDVISASPSMERLVPEGVTVCEWGYEAEHPFVARAEALEAAGVPFWVCPGTSSWNSIGGRLTNALTGCERAASTAGRSSGYLVTDWGDNGHLQPWPVSLPGLAAAATAWHARRLDAREVTAAVNHHCFRDPSGGTGRALAAVGDAHLAIDPQEGNSASIVLHLLFPRLRVGHGPTAGLDTAQLERFTAVLDGAVGELAEARPGASDGELVRAELMQVISLLRLAAEDARARLSGDGSLESVPGPVRAELARRLAPLAEQHRDLWRRRNRPGGLEDSAGRLDHLLDCYRTGAARPFRPAWQGWLYGPASRRRRRTPSGDDVGPSLGVR